MIVWSVSCKRHKEFYELRYHKSRRKGISTMAVEQENVVATEAQPEEKKDSKALKVIGWLSVGMAVAALGIYIGTELRSRSKFKKRTPYDFYAKAGENEQNEFGVGI